MISGCDSYGLAPSLDRSFSSFAILQGESAECRQKKLVAAGEWRQYQRQRDAPTSGSRFRPLRVSSGSPCSARWLGRSCACGRRRAHAPGLAPKAPSVPDLEPRNPAGMAGERLSDETKVSPCETRFVRRASATRRAELRPCPQTVAAHHPIHRRAADARKPAARSMLRCGQARSATD